MRVDAYAPLLRLPQRTAAAAAFSGGATVMPLLVAVGGPLGKRVLALAVGMPGAGRLEVAGAVARRQKIDLPVCMRSDPPERYVLFKCALCGKLQQVARNQGFERFGGRSKLMRVATAPL
jgi:hypothetical protein